MRLTTSPADEYCPAWSPDDRWIASFVAQQCRSKGSDHVDSAAWRAGAQASGDQGRSWMTLLDAGREVAGLSAARIRRRRRPSIWAISIETGERRRLTTFRDAIRKRQVQFG